MDFDPALDVDRLSRDEPVSLLVGISNQGSASETAVRITADLWSGDGSTRLLHTESATLFAAALILLAGFFYGIYRALNRPR